MNWFGFEFSAFLWVFIVLNILNVIVQTVKSIATIKCGAWTAAVVNAIAYGLYTVVVIYMNLDGLGIVWKAVIIGIANLLGVYIVKTAEAKKRKDRLWKVEATVSRVYISALDDELHAEHISHNYVVAQNYGVFNCYCPTQKESEIVKKILAKHSAKYFVSESKTL